MINYEDMRKTVVKFLKESKMSSYDLVRISKDLCSCKECKFFIQHYLKDGKEVDCGHCIQGNTPRSRKPHQASCGHWVWKEDGNGTV